MSTLPSRIANEPAVVRLQEQLREARRDRTALGGAVEELAPVVTGASPARILASAHLGGALCGLGRAVLPETWSGPVAVTLGAVLVGLGAWFGRPELTAAGAGMSVPVTSEFVRRLALRDATATAATPTPNTAAPAASDTAPAV